MGWFYLLTFIGYLSVRNSETLFIFVWDELHRADNSLHEIRNLTPIKTDMTIIMTDEDDVTTTKMMTTHATDKHFIIDVKFMTNALRNVMLSYTKKKTTCPVSMNRSS